MTAARYTWSALDERTWGRVAVTVLEITGVAAVACDGETLMLGASPAARRLLGKFTTGSVELGQKLPSPLLHAVNEYLAAPTAVGKGRPPPIRVESIDGKSSVFVFGQRTTRLGRVVLLVWFHEEVVRDTELLAALQDHYGISARDFRLIQQIRLGHSNREIARNLGLTEGTVKSYLHVLFEQLGVHSRIELLACVERVRRGK